METEKCPKCGKEILITKTYNGHGQKVTKYTCNSCVWQEIEVDE